MGDATVPRAPFRKNLAATVIAILLGTTLSGCASSDQEQSLTIYSGRSESFIAPFFKEFTAQSGIELKIRYGDSSALAAQILEEGENSPADLFISQDAGSLGAVSVSGLLSKLESSLLDRVETKFRSSNNDWVGLTGRARVFAYAPDRVSKLPTSYQSLIEDQYKGKVGIAPTNASFQAFVTTLIQYQGLTAAEIWLQKMVENDVKLYEKNSQIVSAIDSGAIDLGLVNHYYLWEVSESLNRQINVQNGFFEAGDLGNLVNISGAAILNQSTNKSAASELIKYLLSDSAQLQFVADTHEYSVVLVDARPEGLPSFAEIKAPAVDLSRLSDISQTQKLLIKLGLI
jgi:iron(III) transport system substrate-binding protein